MVSRLLAFYNVFKGEGVRAILNSGTLSISGQLKDEDRDGDVVSNYLKEMCIF